MESPVAQWLEHPTRSRRVVGSNPIWNSDFFPSFHLMLKKPYHVVISKTRLDECNYYFLKSGKNVSMLKNLDMNIGCFRISVSSSPPS